MHLQPLQRRTAREENLSVPFFEYTIAGLTVMYARSRVMPGRIPSVRGQARHEVAYGTAPNTAASPGVGCSPTGGRPEIGRAHV